MKILISFCNIDRLSPSSTKRSPLCVINTDTNQLDMLAIPEISDVIGITGLTQDKTYIYAAYQAHIPGIIVLSKHNLHIHEISPLPNVSDIHSLCIHNQHLYIVSTGNDTIFRYTIHNGNINIKSRHIIWKPIGSHGITNTHHINGISSNEGKLIASAFGPKNGILRSSAKNGYIIDVLTKRIAINNIYHPHSVLLQKNTVYYCESATKTVFKNQLPIYEFTEGYIRGLAKYHQTILIGISSFRTTSKSTGIAINPFDVGGTLRKICQIVITEKASINTSTSINMYSYNLSHWYTEIYDIMVLPKTLSIPSHMILHQYELTKKHNAPIKGTVSS